jgi:hypothetical protein
MQIQVKDALIKCAIKAKTIGYIELVKLCNRGIFDYQVGGVIMDLLIDIGNEECLAGRPPINCLVVNERKDSLPGARFYHWHCDNSGDWVDMKSRDSKKDLFDRLAAECYEYWQDVVAES